MKFDFSVHTVISLMYMIETWPEKRKQLKKYMLYVPSHINWRIGHANIHNAYTKYMRPASLLRTAGDARQTLPYARVGEAILNFALK